MITKLKYGIVIFLVISVLILGNLYKNSLDKITSLKVEIETIEKEKEKIVTETNEYKTKTDDLLSKYSQDLLKWQDKLNEAYSDCDKRVDLYRKAESEIPNHKTVINTKTSNSYIKELNKRMKYAKFSNSTKPN